MLPHGFLDLTAGGDQPPGDHTLDEKDSPGDSSSDHVKFESYLELKLWVREYTKKLVFY